MFHRFTKEARDVVVDAQEQARSLRHPQIGPEHLLLAVVHRDRAPGAATLARLGITPQACRAALTAPAAAFDEGDAEALRAFGIDLDAVRGRAEDVFGRGALDAVPPPAQETRRLFGRDRERKRHLPFTRRARKALERSLREALERRDDRIGVEHVLLGVLDTEDRATAGLFRRLGTDTAAVRADVVADLGRAAA
ncbi:Clp protease N-terminal domain-containing protein [Streptomyces cinnamoneus]|uniref:Clp protease n=1 Tax=Streptomyces cinnamoneus TaxID=53446 RepID=A0A918TP48_STRCJ|nr:Clp protease [Streptomyces cinnamoneus]